MNAPFRAYVPGSHPRTTSPKYRSTARRHPTRRMQALVHGVTETTGPRFCSRRFPLIADLTKAKGDRPRVSASSSPA